jgi:lambda family phage portal protein
MGVEMTPYRKPIAYHIAERKNTTELYGSFYVGAPYRRIPAEDIIHIYDPERADQTRGISWMASGMTTARHLGGYIEAAVVNSRAAACKMGFFKDLTGDAGDYTADEKEADTGLQTDIAEPGTFRDIGRHDFVQYDPKYPHEQFDPFTKAMIRFIAAGLGVSYQTLSGDLSETSYASGRQGLLEERETYKSAQEFIRETFLDRVYSEWLTMAIMTGRINLPFYKFGKFNQPKWTGRRWSWVDPLKDVHAAKEARAAGFKSSTQIINEAGGDIEDTYLEIAQENAEAVKLGLVLDYGVKAETGQTNKADADNEDQMDGKPKGKGNGKVAAANA